MEICEGRLPPDDALQDTIRAAYARAISNAGDLQPSVHHSLPYADNSSMPSRVTPLKLSMLSSQGVDPHNFSQSFNKSAHARLHVQDRLQSRSDESMILHDSTVSVGGASGISASTGASSLRAADTPRAGETLLTPQVCPFLSDSVLPRCTRAPSCVQKLVAVSCHCVLIFLSCNPSFPDVWSRFCVCTEQAACTGTLHACTRFCQNSVHLIPECLIFMPS